VARLILLLIFALWLMGPGSMAAPGFGIWIGAGGFIAGYVMLITAVAAWAKLLSRQVEGERLYRSLGRFNRMLTVARAAVPLWLAVGLFSQLGWGHIVWSALGDYTAVYPAEQHKGAMLALPGLILGTAPSLLAWMGLWWAAFPAERALREQSLLNQLDCDLPVHAPPRFRDYLVANIRQQLLLMLLPVLLILLVRDLALVILRLSGMTLSSVETFENAILLPAGLTVFIFAPALLRHVLNTQALPDSPLRRRLEGICRRAGLRYREILLWNTHYSMGNAAVMGLVPRLRYILLSDLLLETLTDQQIEAVFAHEVGHIVHRHMAWYAVFFAGIALAAMGPGAAVEAWLHQRASTSNALGIGGQRVLEVLLALSSLGAMILAFGYISRRFERQADVFAARMLESNWRGQEAAGLPRGSAPGAAAAPAAPAAPPLAVASFPLRQDSHVGQYGATVFSSALDRVAAINNIPVAARSWCHGSILSRMDRLRELSCDPDLTRRFDLKMSLLYAGILTAVAGFGAVAWVVY
jgi:STE24 endopeptidase